VTTELPQDAFGGVTGGDEYEDAFPFVAIIVLILLPLRDGVFVGTSPPSTFIQQET
jgi:hypothetical protein